MELRDHNGLTEDEFMTHYKPGDYNRPSVAVDMVIFTVGDTKEDNYRKIPDKNLCILLIKRGGHPYLGQWALPGGFVRPTENTLEAASRELREETGVTEVYLEQLYTFSDLGRDPRTWVMSCSYVALIDSTELEIEAGDDADQAAWFIVSFHLKKEEKEHLENGYLKTQIYELILDGHDIQLKASIERKLTVSKITSPPVYTIVSSEGLAFDHGKIIAYAMERLRGKVEYSDIALNLMPELFTLTQLQQVYEVILNKELLKAAFRRKIASLVEETDQYTQNAGHRPSRLYRRRKKEFI